MKVAFLGQGAFESSGIAFLDGCLLCLIEYPDSESHALISFQVIGHGRTNSLPRECSVVLVGRTLTLAYYLGIRLERHWLRGGQTCK